MTVAIPIESARVGGVRREMVAALERWGLDAVADDVALVASELVSNAVRHASAREVQVGLWATPETVVVEVVDDAPQPPRYVIAAAEDERGRGLQIVDALASCWGWRRCGSGGKAVWAELAIPVPETGGRNRWIA
ncbi:hypothetical protein SRB5_64250 [Streptomyces sp. RB5]|uniref:Histidine kinase/HSP90-like ATPase domain-containing protein n=1 Tax=Streptomyces smaragdinus TaxID=2585196 RepID=A0A7K0CRW1_9ACTN|nr:ATP-binding protein [Streptomyces smaragdinus]MQY16227.1 hypothetical protein [Streptomyces smaragdinus]